MRRFEGSIYFLVSFAILLLVWEFVVRYGFVDPLFLSSPSAIAIRGWELFSTGEIYPHLKISAIEVAAGFGLATLLGIPLGLMIGRIRPLRSLLEPYVIGLYSMPIVAILPLLIIWFGIGLTSKIAVIFLGSIFPIVITTATGSRTVDASLIEAGISFEASPYQLFRKIVLPASLPFIIAGLRLGVGRALIMMVVAEMYAATAGMGFFVMRAGSLFDTPSTFVGTMILVVAGVGLIQGLKTVERLLAPWSYVDER